MAAYVILDISVTDTTRYEDYKGMASASITKHGGKYLVRGGKHEPLEGDWALDRVVVLEFESVAKARAWWSSEDYSRAKDVRRLAATVKAVLIEGM
jgi:uncharacterized protein (DUF1330 family)